MAGAKFHDEEAQARVAVWKYVFGFTEIAVVKCAIKLGIPDVLENHACMTLAELSSALGCSPSSLYRVMRFLTHFGVFKEVRTDDDQGSSIAYAQTALSRLLTKDRLGPLVLFESCPVMVAPRHVLNDFLVSGNPDVSPFERAHGVDVWQYSEANPSFNELFNKGMASAAGFIISTVVENYWAAFEGIACLVDVGGGNGTTLGSVVKACPWITRAINYDLPHVVPSSDDEGGVEHVGGDMFKTVPKADATLLMSVLHDWGDDACLKILKNCKEAIPEETGKVIIVDHVIDEENHGKDEYKDVQLALDIEMMTHTIKGKERTKKEWASLLTAAGFSKHTITHVPLPHGVIEAYP